jgi:ADP-ribosylglycohydrolase
MGNEPTHTLPADYAERVYAGVLGKVIGVYLGRPFEGWTYERIQERLGDITDYVHDRLGHPLLVTDDDISGTFTFARAISDNGYRSDISSADIGRTWMNYLIEERTILWWGGLGNSTEHTAYLRLKSGIDAPASGSIDQNGQVVAEQIGAQIFIDGWAMVSPGDADQAARLATEAARVSHDGAAVDGAVILAVMEAMAFVESDTNQLLDTALAYVSSDSIIRRLIDDIRDWHASSNDWRDTRAKIAEHYGYDKYGGNCHMVPNHGLIIASLLHANDDFSLGMEIINTSGWDTDCNSGNLGCLMGIKNGLAGIDAGLADWRGPVADRIYIPTADPTWGISDCVREADAIIDMGRRIQGAAHEPPKQGARVRAQQRDRQAVRRCGLRPAFLTTRVSGSDDQSIRQQRRRHESGPLPQLLRARR